MACESFVEHLLGPLYFLQRMLFLRISQNSMSLAIYLYLRAGFFACRGWLFLKLKLLISVIINPLRHIESQNSILKTSTECFLIIMFPYYYYYVYVVWTSVPQIIMFGNVCSLMKFEYLLGC